jgi:hypothetical protein
MNRRAIAAMGALLRSFHRADAVRRQLPSSRMGEELEARPTAAKTPGPRSEFGWRKVRPGYKLGLPSVTPNSRSVKHNRRAH